MLDFEMMPGILIPGSRELTQMDLVQSFPDSKSGISTISTGNGPAKAAVLA